ncbi:hypothetical protein ACFL6T_06690 [Candidatus Zixiibacteriota bacterium]
MAELTTDLTALRKGLETGTTSVVRAFDQAKRLRRRALITRLAVAFAVLSTTLLVVTQLTWKPSPAGTPQVVIALFENQSDDQGLDVVGTTLTSEVTRQLRSISAASGTIDVVEYSLARQFNQPGVAGENKVVSRSSIKRLARRTRSTLVVAGSYSQTQDGLTVRLNIHDMQSDDPVPSPDPIYGQVEAPDHLAELVSDRLMGALAAYLDPLFKFLVAGSTPPQSYNAFESMRQAFEIQFSHVRMELREEDAFSLLIEAAGSDSSYLTPILWAVDLPPTIITSQSDSLMQIYDYRRVNLLQFLQLRRQRLNPIEQKHLDYLHLSSSERENDHRRYEIAVGLAKVQPHSIWSLRAGSIAINLYQLRQAVKHLETVLLFEDLTFINNWTWIWDYAGALWKLGENDRFLEYIQSVPLEQYVEPLNRKVIELFKVQAMIMAGKIDDFWNVYREKEIEILETWCPNMMLWGELLVPLWKTNQPDHARQLFVFAENWFNDQPDRVQNLLGFRCLHAQACFFAKQWDQAQDLLEDIVTDLQEIIEPDTVLAFHPENYGFGYHVIGSYPGALTMWGCAAASNGDEQTAVIADSLLTELGSSNNGQYIYHHACIAAARGKREHALRLLREVIVDERFFVVEGPEGKHWYHFRSLIDDSEYRSLFRPRLY